MLIDLVPFAELLSTIVDNRGRTCPTARAGLPLIATNCIRNELLYPAFDNVRYVDAETYSTWFRDHPEPGDIVFVCKGSPGRVCMVPDPVTFCIAQDMVAVRANPKKIYPKYLFAALRMPAVQAQIGNMHVGTLIPHFKKGDFDKLMIPVPDKGLQKSVGDAYFELSRKIDLNRRMNTTLEALARALFHNWFVDFGQSSGKAPADWRWSTVGGELKPVLGGTPSRANAEYWTNGGVPWINSGKTNEFRVIEPSEWISAEALANSATKMVPARTTVLAITGATLGQVSIVEIDCCANQSVVAIPASDALPTEFIYPWIKENIQKLVASQTGGAQQHINKGNVEELPILVPGSAAMDAYLRDVRPLFDKIAANCFESRTLASLRDALLPKVLGGKLRIPEATKNIENVV
jgi:type I restriction enzyme S subunit